MPLKTGFYLLSFNTQPPEGGWLSNRFCLRRPSAFQHTAARRRLVSQTAPVINAEGFQHTAARRRLAIFHHKNDLCRRFNTQPPEGGWLVYRRFQLGMICFNTQPPEGGWAIGAIPRVCVTVSTHSRPKAAGVDGVALESVKERFNTQPPEGGWRRLTVKPWRRFRFQHTAARRRLEKPKKAGR